MFCTIKFVYYKSFCVRDDIGSYIRTVYHMVSHTPKPEVPGSSPGRRARTSEGANTVPFPPHGENCTMLAPSSFSESNPLRWASIYFFYNKAGKHNLCLPAFAYSFGFPFLLFEKCYHNGAGARMGSDHTSYGRIANFFQVSFPDVTAVFDIF